MKTSDISDEIVYEAIRKTKADKYMKGFPYDYHSEIPMKVFLNKMSKMVDQGKLNYGVSLRTAWIEIQ